MTPAAARAILTRGALLALLVVILTGCAATLSGPYDPISDERTTDLHRKVTSVLGLFPGAPYDAARDAYTHVRDDLHTLIARSEARPYNDLATAQLHAIAQQWDELEALHQTRPLSRALVEIARRTLGQALTAVMASEQAKRRLP